MLRIFISISFSFGPFFARVCSPANPKLQIRLSDQTNLANFRVAKHSFENLVRNIRSIACVCLVVCFSCLTETWSAQGNFERLGIPVRKGGLMGCIVGPDGKGGE